MTVRATSGALVALVTLTVLVVAACSGPQPVSPSSSTTAGSVARHVGPREPLPGFGEVTVTVVAADGTSRTFCLLLADTEALRAQGLMFVTDPSLGGYDGMLFAYEDDDEGGFWMKNTRLPLSILFATADGATVSTTDMEPCPDGSTICPSYPPGGAYRYAVEVLQGRWGDLGVSKDSRLLVGAHACDALTDEPVRPT